MSDTDLSSRIRQRREQLSLSQEELAARMGYRSKSSITKLEKGINDLPRAKLEELAAALDTTPAWLMGLADLPCPPPGFEPLPEMARVPLVGSIACGTPITAEQNIECYIGVPAAWHADFALTCHGNSMAPTICDGDIVCIRRQPEVEQGEIAAVRIGEEATLKHFHRQGDSVTFSFLCLSINNTSFLFSFVPAVFINLSHIPSNNKSETRQQIVSFATFLCYSYPIERRPPMNHFPQLTPIENKLKQIYQQSPERSLQEPCDREDVMDVLLFGIDMTFLRLSLFKMEPVQAMFSVAVFL